MTEQEPKQTPPPTQEEKQELLEAIKSDSFWPLMEPSVEDGTYTEQELADKFAEFASRMTKFLMTTSDELFPKGKGFPALAVVAVLKQVFGVTRRTLQMAMLESMLRDPDIMEKLNTIVEKIVEETPSKAEERMVADAVKNQQLN